MTDVVIDAPTIATTTAQRAAVVRLTIPRSRMQAEMPVAIREVMASVARQGLRATGPLFAHHLAMSAESFDFEVGVPVDGTPVRDGRVAPGELPAATVVRTVYHGGYEGLHRAWEEFGRRAKHELTEAIERQRLEPADTIWERYLAGPESSADPSTWRTELNQPMRRAG